MQRLFEAFDVVSLGGIFQAVAVVRGDDGDQLRTVEFIGNFFIQNRDSRLIATFAL